MTRCDRCKKNKAVCFMFFLKPSEGLDFPSMHLLIQLGLLSGKMRIGSWSNFYSQSFCVSKLCSKSNFIIAVSMVNLFGIFCIFFCICPWTTCFEVECCACRLCQTFAIEPLSLHQKVLRFGIRQIYLYHETPVQSQTYPLIQSLTAHTFHHDKFTSLWSERRMSLCRVFSQKFL